ncbi:MAG TPA: DsbA family protein [Verrucomicrobiota bacterium]|nr:DsbA family protein [Verrucomicrobiota bacterium]
MSSTSGIHGMIRITYYLDVVSSWCWWAEPAWAELKERYAGRAEFNWQTALIPADALPATREQEDWFYRRSEVITRSPYRLNGGWLEPGLGEYLAPNAVAEAAKDFDVPDDRVRLAVARAAVLEGRPVGRWEIAAEAGAAGAGLDPAKLLAHARSPAVEQRVRASRAAFHALQVTQRPAFVIEDDIGDRAVLSGLWTAAPFAGVIEAMLADTAAYAAWRAHFGDPPAG